MTIFLCNRPDEMIHLLQFLAIPANRTIESPLAQWLAREVESGIELGDLDRLWSMIVLTGAGISGVGPYV